MRSKLAPKVRHTSRNHTRNVEDSPRHARMRDNGQPTRKVRRKDWR